MSSDFEAEILKLADKYTNNSDDSRNREADSNLYLNEVLKEFHSVAQKGADLFNKAQKGEVLKVYELPPDLLEIFLGITAGQGGLCIVSPAKISVFFGEKPNLITVIGKLRNNKGGMRTDFNKSLKLIQLSCSESEIGFEYKDNTGNNLSSEDAVAVILGWLVS